MTELSRDLITECRKRLLSMKEELLNGVRTSRLDLTASDKMMGDEIDQTVAQLEENSFLITQKRLREKLLEVENALARIEMGNFGLCEETHEPIEPNRLLALPYTRLSIEGAELREAMTRKFAR